MASTNFQDGSTVIAASWLNDVDELVYGSSKTWTEVTSGGTVALSNDSAFQSDTPPVQIWRLGGRVFVGEASDGLSGYSAASPDQAGSWYADDTAARYVPRDATLVSASPNGRIGIAAVSRSSDATNPSWNVCIGVASHVVNDLAAGGGYSAGSAWGFIAELQAEPGSNVTHGIEIGAKNKKGSDANTDPYLINAGVTGVWLAGGGDNRFGGSATGPADAGIVILKNQQSGLTGGGWKSGIVFTEDSIDGADGTASSPNYADAIRLARGHKITWYEPTTGVEGFSIHSRVDAATYAININATDIGGNPYIDFASTQGSFARFRGATSANADYCVLQAGAGTTRLNAEGPSTNIDLYLSTKGTGTLRFGTWTTSSDVAVNGYITVKDDGGNTRKLATIA